MPTPLSHIDFDADMQGVPVTWSLEDTSANVKAFAQRARVRLLHIEDAIASMPGALLGDNAMCPLTHRFSGNLYVREIFIPAGVLLTGKIHRHEHPNVLLEGEVTFYTESTGTQRMRGPQVLISAPGTKRLIYTHTDVRWVTMHEVGQERDLERIEAMLIAPTFEALAMGEAEFVKQLEKGEA